MAMVGVACGSQVPAGWTPPWVLRRSIFTTLDSSPAGVPSWVASRLSSAMLPLPLAFLVTTLPVTPLPSGACHCGGPAGPGLTKRSEEHTSELQSQFHLV